MAKNRNNLKLCRLCLQLENLVDSHILPRSFYKNHEENGEVIDKIFSEEDGRFLKRLSGVYGQFMCSKCEEKTQFLDDFAFKVFYRQDKLPVYHPNTEKIISYQVEIDNAKKLSLFFIFVLWRAYVSERKEFKSVSLGEMYAEKFRLAILNNDLDQLKEIGIVICKFDKYMQAFLFPTKEKILGVNCYRVCFPGYRCFIKIDKRPFPRELSSLSLSKAENSLIMVVSGWSGSKEHLAMMKMLSKPKKQMTRLV